MQFNDILEEDDIPQPKRHFGRTLPIGMKDND
jgi:hypothetical protein